jgi:hypothetical protein
MIRRTLNNMEKAVQLIMAKGYDYTEANEIAMQCFDDAEFGSSRFFVTDKIFHSSIKRLPFSETEEQYIN